MEALRSSETSETAEAMAQRNVLESSNPSNTTVWTFVLDIYFKENIYSTFKEK